MPATRIVSFLFLCTLALPCAAQDRLAPGLSPPTHVSLSTDAQPRSAIDINRDVRAALRQERAAETPEERAGAIYRLVRLYREILEHPQLEENPAALIRNHATLWRRLARLQNHLERDLERSSSHRPSPRSSQLPSSSEGTAAFGGLAQNDAQALIELIEATISPEVWENRGGPGRIRYYPPGLALVVSAPSQVHRDVGRVLQQLRAARQ